MKRVLKFLHLKLIMAPVLLLSWAVVQIASADDHKKPVWKKVADSNFNQCLEKIAKKKNWTLAEEFQEIKCHSNDIKSVDGIEQFTQVKSISFYNNAIEQFPSEPFIMLKSLNLAKNEIQHFKLNKGLKLENLYLFKNKLEVLTLENLPSLVQLKANSNQIKQFSYAALPKLEKVYLFDNAMENIDIYSLPSLKYMDVRQNPMPDKLYEEMDEMNGVTIWHDGNADDWN